MLHLKKFKLKKNLHEKNLKNHISKLEIFLGVTILGRKLKEEENFDSVGPTPPQKFLGAMIKTQKYFQ